MTALVFVEHDNTEVKDATLATVTAAKAYGDVHLLVAGSDCGSVAEAAAKIDGVAKVLVADSAAYEHPLAEELTAIVLSIAGDYDAILAPATTTGKNFMPRVAASLDVAQISDIIEV
ncbi:MAG: electron transfer flavoprotein subunit alpha/FixB family protein, partial [Kordiimonadaceae bacterium]|nr:electron transfer flavoprotein subunit alpha/FixB family protein [Kordiimonadaceae bacterium]